MKSRDVRLNTILWSRSQNCMGQAIAMMSFMVLVLFVHQAPLWLPASDLEYEYDKL